MRWMKLAAVVISGLAGIAAAQPAGKSDKPLVVGFSQVGAESEWRTAETKSIREEAERRGAELKFADAQGKQVSQIRSVKSFITQRVDFIIIAPVVETGWEPVLREAKAAKIPVILVDRGIKLSESAAGEDLYATLIASDFVEEGRMAAEWLVEATGGTAGIVELQGTTGAAPAIDRQKGFAEVIANHPGMKILKSQSADFTRAKGREVMQSFIKAEAGRITAVYAHNDDMALGAIQALEEAGIKPHQQVKVVSIDAVKGAFESMAAGKLSATVECNPLLGPIVFDTIEQLRAGQAVPRFIKQTDRLYEQKDAAEAIKTRQY